MITKKQFIWVSPVLVVVIHAITIRVAAGVIGVWAWLPWVLVYWGIIAGWHFGEGERNRCGDG